MAKPSVHPVRCKRACNTHGLLDQFLTKCLSDVAIAKFRAQSQNEGRIDRALATHPYFNVGTYSVNLVNIDPVHSEITGLQGDS